MEAASGAGMTKGGKMPDKKALLCHIKGKDYVFVPRRDSDKQAGKSGCDGCAGAHRFNVCRSLGGACLHSAGVWKETELYAPEKDSDASQ